MLEWYNRENNKPKCDKCGKFFEPKPKTTKLKDGIHKSWFKCPYCKAVYLINYDDLEIRKLQAKQREIRQKNANVTHDKAMSAEDKEKAIEDNMKQYEENKEKLGVMMSELRGKMESAAN